MRAALLLLGGLVLATPTELHARSAAPAGPALVVGTTEAPPFVVRGADGHWTGLSIELWRQVALEMGRAYELREYDLAGLLAAVEAREVDVAIGAITINAQRERRLDFSHPVYSTGLSIAVRSRAHGGVLDAARSLLTWDFASGVATLLLLLGISGALVWLAERRTNAAQFGGGPLRGMGAGLWWSAVTMTTVGYGDKAPVTVVGRLIALVWMVAAIVLFSFFTASITSALTVQRLETEIQGPDDLGGKRIGTIAGSTSAAHLDMRGLRYISVASVAEGVRAVADGQLDAVVYDAPILQYAVRSMRGGISVLPRPFKRQDYGFALPEGSALREPLNRALLVELVSERWTALRDHYLGK